MSKFYRFFAPEPYQATFFPIRRISKSSSCFTYLERNRNHSCYI